MADPIVTVTITRSAGTDGAVLVLIDTTEHFQPGSRPIRVLLNEADVFADVPYLHPEDDQLREAGEVTIDVMADQIAYRGVPEHDACPQCERTDDCECEIGLV